jgi:hypothetical protein
MAKQRGKGRPFEKGNPGGPGRPKAPKEREYLDMFRSRVPLEEWGDAVTKMLEMAKDGNVKCFEALAKYCLPQPVTMLELGRETREAFRVAGIHDKELAEKMARKVVETFKIHQGEAA